MIDKSAAKYVTLFTGVIAFIIGLIVAFMPLEMSVVVNYLIVIALGIGGIASICQFISDSERNGWDLVLGILCLVVSLFLLSNGALVVEATAGYVLAFLAIVDAIRHFALCGKAEQFFGSSKASFIIFGIIELLLAMLLIGMPIITQGVYFWVLGIFLIVFGIITFIRGLTISTKKPAKSKK